MFGDGLMGRLERRGLGRHIVRKLLGKRKTGVAGLRIGVARMTRFVKARGAARVLIIKPSSRAEPLRRRDHACPAGSTTLSAESALSGSDDRLEEFLIYL